MFWMRLKSEHWSTFNGNSGVNWRFFFPRRCSVYKIKMCKCIIMCLEMEKTTKQLNKDEERRNYLR